MKEILLRELYRNTAEYGGQEVVIKGWVRNNRASNKFGFIELNDGSFFKSVQVVYEEEFLNNFEEIAKAYVATALEVKGVVEITPNAKQPFEIKAREIKVEATSTPDYPLQPKRHSMEFLREIAHLRPRSNMFSAVFRVRSLVAYAIHQFFQDQNFVYVHTPIITGSDCEGAGEMFRVTTLDMDNPPRDEEGNIDYVNELLRYIISVMVAIFLPFVLVVWLYGEDVIRLIYERGSFDAESTKAVATMFLIYSLGILGYVTQELFNKILYLAGKYKYTVTGTVIVVAINVIGNILISGNPPEGADIAVVIASSTSVWLTLYAVAIAFGIRKVVGAYWKKELVVTILKILVSGILAYIVYVIFNTLLPEFTHGYISFIVPLGASGVVYAASLAFTGTLKKLIKRDRKA